MAIRSSRLRALGISAASAALLCAAANASEADAARLGADLTYNGAEAGANADGSIPAFDGGLQSAPAGWSPGSKFVDPYGGDAIAFTITAANMAQYADKLTDGQKALLAKYPDTYKLNVYPTHRSCGLPAAAQEWNKKNAVTGELTADGNGITGVFFSTPFPVPKNGLEQLWNHIMRYRGASFVREFKGAQVYPSGQVTPIRIQDEGLFRYSNPDKTSIAELNNISIYFLQQVVEPTRMAGTILLIHESLDQARQPRQVWTYNPGQRRVRRAPDIQYDNPGTGSDGLTTSDSYSIFNGAPDRYTWESKGKKENYIAYNAYKLASSPKTIKELATPNHFNQDELRYELHRVWITEGKLKPDTRHIYHRRVFYQDEDSWQIAASELYDARGELYRIQESHPINYYSIPACFEAGTMAYTLADQAYYVDALINETKPIAVNVPIDENRFDPSSLRQIGVR